MRLQSNKHAGFCRYLVAVESGEGLQSGVQVFFAVHCLNIGAQRLLHC